MDKDLSTWCLVDEQSGSVLFHARNKSSVEHEQEKNKYGQTFTKIAYGYEDQETGDFVATPEPTSSNKKPLKITINDGMINIDSDAFAYSNVRGMYVVEGKQEDGAGIQIDENLSENKSEITNLCNLISQSLYKIDDILKSKAEPAKKMKM